MKPVRFPFFIIIGFFLILTQSMQIIAAPVSVSSSAHHATQVMSDDCQHHLNAASDSSECCSQNGDSHQCSNECGQCFTAGTHVSILNMLSALVLKPNTQVITGNAQYFYSFLPQNALRPPIA